MNTILSLNPLVLLLLHLTAASSIPQPAARTAAAAPLSTPGWGHVALQIPNNTVATAFGGPSIGNGYYAEWYGQGPAAWDFHFDGGRYTYEGFFFSFTESAATTATSVLYQLYKTESPIATETYPVTLGTSVETKTSAYATVSMITATPYYTKSGDSPRVTCAPFSVWENGS